MIFALLVAADVAKLFTQEAEVSVTKPGLQRLLLPESVLRVCKSDLSDLRLWADDKEIPYIVDSQRQAAPVRRQVVTPELRNVKHDGGRETFELVFAEPVTGKWTLVFETQKTELVRRCEIVDPTTGNRTEGSIYRLPAMGRERLAMPIELKDTRRLVIALEGEQVSYVDPRMTLVRDMKYGSYGSQLNVTFDRLIVRQSGKRTRIEVLKQRGVMPTAITIAPQDALFDRAVRVYDSGVLLGEGRIFRTADVEELSLPLLRQARGDKLLIEIEDKDSPALQQVAVTATLDQPTLFFTANQSLKLLFGGGRAAPPEYDIAHLLSDKPETFLKANVATVGEPRANASFDSQPLLQYAMRAGAVVDARLFQQRVAFNIDAVGEGVTRVVPTSDDVAKARDDLADLRIVDKQARQWPYLLVKDGERSERPVYPMVDDGRYVFNPGRVRVTALTMPTEQTFFDRAFTLTSAGHTLSSGRLVKSASSTAPVVITFPPTIVDTLVLAIDNGNDAPLRLIEPSITTVLPELFVTAPPGEYYLLSGNANAPAPSYELERIRDSVLAVPFTDASMRLSEANPDYSSLSKLNSGPGPMQLALWAVIIFAVLALAALTLRLAKA